MFCTFFIKFSFFPMKFCELIMCDLYKSLVRYVIGIHFLHVHVLFFHSFYSVFLRRVVFCFSEFNFETFGFFLFIDHVFVVQRFDGDKCFHLYTTKEALFTSNECQVDRFFPFSIMFFIFHSSENKTAVIYFYFILYRILFFPTAFKMFSLHSL